MIDREPKLQTYKARALNALFFLRFLSPFIVNSSELKDNMKIAKMFVSNLIDNAHKEVLDVETFLLEKVESMDWSTNASESDVKEDNNNNNNEGESDNAYFDVDTSFVGEDNPLEKSESLLIGIVDKLMEHKEKILSTLKAEGKQCL